MPMPVEQSGYTYADYKNWNSDERWELIDGEAYLQASPGTAHQEAAGGFYAQLREQLRGKPCRPYIAPLSVRLEAKDDESDSTVLEPDVFVVCEPSKMRPEGCFGAPDLVIEVLSPSTARMDRVVKFRKYLTAGVREYWLADPETQTVQVNTLSGGMYACTAYQSPEQVPVSILPGCRIDLGGIFPGGIDPDGIHPVPPVPGEDPA